MPKSKAISHHDVISFISLGMLLADILSLLLSLPGSERPTYNHHTTFYAGAALFQGTHIASVPLLARAWA
ncbi:MAG TPA: hypothetical protein VFK47_24195 [Ktedonobacteraceae bacterium]|nr:hypothetical protein [Ktedonobacteraceae bacterium]